MVSMVEWTVLIFEEQELQVLHESENERQHDFVEGMALEVFSQEKFNESRVEGDIKHLGRGRLVEEQGKEQVLFEVK